MEAYSFRLNFESSLVVGSPTRSMIPSDVLFGAFCHAFRLLRSERCLKDLLDEFVDDSSATPFILSSAYPYWEETLFFPKPILYQSRDRALQGESSSRRSNLGDAKFLDHNLWSKYLEGDWDAIGYMARDARLSTRGDLLSIQEIPDMLYLTSERPRVAVDRHNSVSTLHHVKSLEFAEPNAGAHFLAIFRDQDMLNEFYSALQLLQHEGIGGERSSGYGRFRCEPPEELYFSDFEEPNWFTSLSLFMPSKNEAESSAQGYYALSTRGGWVYSSHVKNYRKKTIRMFTEGSAFPNSGQIGSLVDVTPTILTSHRTFRYGLSFKVPMAVPDHEV